MRKAAVKRKTKEDRCGGRGQHRRYRARARSRPGIGFRRSHARPSGTASRIDISVTAKGDLHIDHHHTTEDVGIALGQA
jgi:imidazoleglycerol-phosphate dehydratase